MPTSGVRHAALVPGLPHLLAADPAPSWADLARATTDLGDRVRDEIDAWMVVSTQWFTVLGFQFQTASRLVGRRIDENWYDRDYGVIDYELTVEPALTEAWIGATRDSGFDVHRTDYDGFPVDTGVITAMSLLDPRGEKPISVASMNLYAGPETMTQLGETAAAAAARSGARVCFVAVSGLSAGVHQAWLQPHEEAIFSDEHDAWNRRVLGQLEAGDLDTVLAAREEYASGAAVDSQFRAITLLAGTGSVGGPAEVMAYGSIWGTGAAVVHWDSRKDQM